MSTVIAAVCAPAATVDAIASPANPIQSFMSKVLSRSSLRKIYQPARQRSLSTAKKCFSHHAIAIGLAEARRAVNMAQEKPNR
jgi:hypothetical protein